MERTNGITRREVEKTEVEQIANLCPKYNIRPGVRPRDGVFRGENGHYLASLRRRLILSVLLGEISQNEAERRAGMAQGSMSRAVASAKREPEASLLNAEEEVEFRRRVAEILAS